MGIPPLCGFISKYYLASAAIEGGGVWALMGTGALLVSSLLTAVYTLSTLLPAFFYTFDESAGVPLEKNCDPGWRMLLPFCLIAAACLMLGVCSSPLAQTLRGITGV